jgi:hypothetical protein
MIRSRTTGSRPKVGYDIAAIGDNVRAFLLGVA